MTAQEPALPALAHGGEVAGTDIELVLFGIGALVGAFIAFRSPQAKRWVAPLLGLLGAALIAAGIVLPRIDDDAAGSSDAVVEIIDPAAGGQVPAGKPVTVRVGLRNAPLAESPTSESGGHLHLYVDGKLQQMPYSRQMDIELDEGRHEITVEYVDEQHLSFDPPVQETVTVTAR